MRKATADDLIRADSRLSRSLLACVVFLAGQIVWAFVGGAWSAGTVAIVVFLALLLGQLASYVWFAVAAGAAAQVLGEKPWGYVVWILAAPILALVPIPILSTLILASPLSIKFLLGRQLDTAIREAAFAD
jgi:hypothetical protein